MGGLIFVDLLDFTGVAPVKSSTSIKNLCGFAILNYYFLKTTIGLTVVF